MKYVKDKDLDKLVDKLELLIPLVEAGYENSRLEYLMFRQKTINTFNVEIFNRVSYLTNVRLYGEETK